MEQTVLCPLIRDLLPLYVDGLTSEETNAVLREHLQTCGACRAHYQAFTQAIGAKQAADLEERREEIDYMKKIRKNTAKKIVLASLSAVAALAAVLFVFLFVAGHPSDAYAVTYLDADGGTVRIGGVFYDSAAVYHSYQIDDDGNLVIYAALPSPWNREGVFHLELPADSVPETGLHVNGITVQPDGTVISRLANTLFSHKNPYIGDMPANGRLAADLGIAADLGNFTNTLQTTEEPYGWMLTFADSTANSAILEEKMKAYACVLTALVDNLGEVSWEYTVELTDGPAHRTGRFTQAECSALVGGDIKSFAQSPESIQKLLELTGLD